MEFTTETEDQSFCTNKIIGGVLKSSSQACNVTTVYTSFYAELNMLTIYSNGTVLSIFILATPLNTTNSIIINYQKQQYGSTSSTQREMCMWLHTFNFPLQK